MTPVLMGLARYIPKALSGAKNIAAQQGGYGLARNFAMPAIAGEIAGKGISYATGIPEEYVDAAMMTAPAVRVAKGVSAMSKPIALYKPTGQSVLKLAADRGTDAVLDNANYSEGITPQRAMQGFYEFINPNQVAAARDQQNYTGLQEWFYGSQTPLNQLPNPQRMMPNPPQTFVNDAYRDSRDFTDHYNTPLTPQEEAGYRTWLNSVHPRQRNTRDYDLQGYYKAARDGIDPSRFKLAVDPEGNLHFDDRFKKPNHYTFSTDSMYSGRDGYYGGQWHELGNNKYSYIVNPSNLYSNAELQDYFNRNEIGNILIDQRGRR